MQGNDERVKRAYDIFFRLLRLGLGLTDRIELKDMDRKFWLAVLRISERQAMMGIIMDAISRLPEETTKPDNDLLLKLIGLVTKIEKRNRIVNCEAVKWTNYFKEKVFGAILLKGQGLANLYPSPLHRMAGDIDLWVTGNSNEVRELAVKELGAKEIIYHHIGIEDGGQAVLEIHTTPSWMYSYTRNRILQEMFLQWSKSWQEMELEDAGRIYVPADEMNRVYLLIHMYRHVFSEGIGLRQLTDYAMLLNKGCSEEEKEVFRNHIRRLNMKGFAGAVMYVVKEIFGLEDGKLPISPDRKRGEKLLAEIIEGGNFGLYDDSINRDIESDSIMSFIVRNRRNLRLLKDYTEEVLWAPAFKIWHWAWRKKYKHLL